MVQIQLSGAHITIDGLLKGQDVKLELSQGKLREEAVIAVQLVIDGQSFQLGPLQTSALAALLEQP